MAVAGKVAITPKGEWNANTAYTKLDLVFYENASYVAIQPSTGVTPTNTAYWMLVVQSAGGADLEAIIDGTTQVGNAKTLDGHEAEYFLPKSGGKITGIIEQDNSKRNIVQSINGDGLYQLYDNTNKKNIIYSEPDGTTTFGGTANGNLPLSGGTVGDGTTASPFAIKGDGTPIYLVFKSKWNEVFGHLGFYGKDNPVYVPADGSASKQLLHTGNKPTGSYTGNGSATERVIATGGIGEACLVRTGGGGRASILTPNRSILSDSSGVRSTTDAAFTASTGITLRTTDSALNENGVTYYYQVL